MNFSAESTFVEIVRVLTAFGLMCVITFLVFIGGQWLAKALGQNGIKVISRLMGLILAVVGVQMLIDGIRGAVAA
jgi:multiple antibiotic resistance protein